MPTTISTAEDEESHRDLPPATPLPWRQLIVLLLMRLAEPISYSFVFPFIGNFVYDLGVTKDRSKIGMYAGIVESSFAIIQFITILQWARASDRFGRKPILLNGLIGTSLSSLCIGFSSSFPMLVFSRCLAGALNGNVAIYKATIGEMTDKTNSARAFSFISLTWSSGMVIGNAMGGYLERPAKHYPRLFSTEYNAPLAFGGLWERRPYLLPCLCASMLSFSTVLLGYTFLEETEPKKVAAKKHKMAQINEQTPLLQANRNLGQSSQSREEDNTTIWDLLKIQHIRRMMLSYAFLGLTQVSIEAVSILYFWEPIRIGGLSFPSTVTGTILSGAGVLGIIIQLGIFPPLQRRLGTLPLYRKALKGYIFVPILMPLANLVARSGLIVSHERQGGFLKDVNFGAIIGTLTIVIIAISIKTAATMAFPCNVILVNQSAALVRHAPMGTLNGLAQMSSTLMFAIGPYTSSTLFALTIEKHLLGGYLVWILITFVAIGGVIISHGLIDIEDLIDKGEIDEDDANRRG